jgi:hypothetical protein
MATVFVAVGMSSAQTVREVDCDKESLRNAVAASAPGDTLSVSGTCREAVTITLDRFTLDGGGMAVLDGGVPGGTVGGNGGAFHALIVIDGARGVTLRGLTLRNGPGGGVIGRANGAFSLQQVVIQNSYFGMAVVNSSYAQISDSEISGNTDAGLGVVNSTVDFHGQVKINRNVQGISASGNCDLELPGTDLETSGNKTHGILISGCSLNIRNFGAPSRITANDNGGDGFFIGGGQLVASEPVVFGYSGQQFHQIIATNNKGSGINLAGFASIVNLGGAIFNLSGNATGLNVSVESSVLTMGGLRIGNNDVGILADGAGTLTLASTAQNPSMVQNNATTDMELRFGTRMMVSGVAIDKVKCDGTILSRGSTKCP